MASNNIARVKQNVQKMVSSGAPERDIDAYIAAEGVSIDAIKAFNAPKKQNHTTAVQAFANKLNPLNQVGLDDELYGATTALTKAVLERRMPRMEDYQKGKDFKSSQTELATEEHPYASTAGSVSGMVGVGLMSPTQTITGGMKAAAGIGGLTGFGQAEGGFVNRFSNSIGSAALSASLAGVIGAALKSTPIVFNGAKKFTGQIKDSFSDSGDDVARAAERSTKKLIASLQKDKIAPDQIENAIKNGKSIFDIAGRHTQDMAETTALYPGAREATEDFFTNRAAGTPTRLKQSIAKFVSKRMDYEYLADDITNAGKKASAELYKKAYAVKPKLNQEIQEILSTPAGKSALKNAQELMMNERKNPGDIGFELLDYVKRGFDIDINKYKDPLGRLNLDDNGRAIVALRSGLNNQMKKINPAYANAVDKAGDYLSNVEAINKGLKFNKYTPKELGEIFEELTPSEKTSFLAGVSGNLRQRIDSAVTGNVSKKAIPNETTVQQLKSFLSKESFKELTDTISNERTFYDLQKKVLGGSQTATRSSFRKQFEADTDIINMIRGGGVLSRGIDALTKKIVMATDGLNQKTAKNIAELLYETDPKKQLSILTNMKLAAEKGDYGARQGIDIYGGFMDATKNILKSSLPAKAGSEIVRSESVQIPQNKTDANNAPQGAFLMENVNDQ